MKQKTLASLLIFVTLFLAIPWVTFQPKKAAAQQFPLFIISTGPFKPFGGNLVKKNLSFCLRSLPFFPWVLVIPFQVFLVYRPSPAGLYWLYGISELYEEYEFEETVNTLGNYVVGADKAWRAFCDINGHTLPTSISGTTWWGVPFRMPVLGVAWKMGDSCKVPPKYINDACHKKVLKRTLKQIAEYLALLAAGLAIVRGLPSIDQAQFNSTAEGFVENCDAFSPNGECYPAGTCDPTQSAAAGACVFNPGMGP